MANDESKCVPQKWFALNFLQKSLRSLTSVLVCWCIESLYDSYVSSNYPIFLFVAIHFVFLIPLRLCRFLWVDRIYWPMPTLRVVYTTRKNHWPASMKLFSRRRFSAVCSSLTHFQRLFASSACAIDWAGIFRHFYRRLIFRNRSKQARNCKKTGTHNSRYMFVNVLACEWLEREFEREIRQKTGLLIMIQIW